MSYYCKKCKEERTQGCFARGCPGIPLLYEMVAPDELVRATREAGQREQLAQQLQGRERAPVNVADYGSPALDET